MRTAIKKMTQDHVLLKQYQEGNPKAFDVLYDRHKGGLFRYVLAIVGDTQTAEDIIQDLF